MVMFPKDAIQIYREVTDGEQIGVDDDGDPILAVCGTDNYNLPKKCMVLINTVIGDFQMLSANDSKKEFGEVKQGSARAYLPYKTVVENDFKVKVPDLYPDVYFQVEGDPIHRNMFQQTKILLVMEG